MTDASSADLDTLVAELVEIGSTPNKEEGSPFFWRAEGEGVGPNEAWDRRTREIGEELHRLGQGSIALMRRAHEGVVAALGSLAGHALSAHWHEVGEEAWQAGQGECWMH